MKAFHGLLRCPFVQVKVTGYPLGLIARRLNLAHSEYLVFVMARSGPVRRFASL